MASRNPPLRITGKWRGVTSMADAPQRNSFARAISNEQHKHKSTVMNCRVMLFSERLLVAPTSYSVSEHNSCDYLIRIAYRHVPRPIASRIPPLTKLTMTADILPIAQIVPSITSAPMIVKKIPRTRSVSASRCWMSFGCWSMMI